MKFIKSAVVTPARMTHTTSLLAAFISLAVLASGVQAQTSTSKAAPKQIYDTPLRKVTVRLAPTEEGWARKAQCHFYKTLMLKEITVDQDIGPSQTSVVPVTGDKQPKCQAKNADERILEETFSYVGKVGKFGVFADDDASSVRDFTVVDLDAGKVVFKDSFFGGERLLSGASADGDAFELRYQRGLVAECDGVGASKACWAKVRKATGLPEAPTPRCSDAKADVVGYPVVAKLIDGRVTTVPESGGKLTCTSSL